jgi:UDP-GlcNAc:undecaprenyl-phosphate GlcNAc-1-phosphate transferase
MIVAYLVVFFLCVFLSLVFTRSFRNLAIRMGLARGPELPRHIHESPVPRVGGVAIFVSFILVTCSAMVVSEFIGVKLGLPIREALGLLGPACVVFLVGVYDDLRTLGPFKKFGIEAFAATMLYFGGYGIHQVDFFLKNRVLGTAIGLPLTIGWVLLITNAFNLIDGLDGLAAGSALFSTLVVLTMSIITPYPIVTFLSIALAGSIIGFLRFNFHPASIFLGDSGSLFIGFMLSALALAGAQKAPTVVAVAIPVVSFGLPILDVVLAVIRRFLRGKPLFSGDDEHIHHKLLKRGLRQREVALILYAVTAVFGLLSLALFHGGAMVALILAVIGVGVWLGVQHLRYLEFFELQSVFQRTMQHKQVIANNLGVRRACELLNSCTELHQLCRIVEEAMRPLGFDGFRFRNSVPFRLPESLIGPFYVSPEGEFRCCWSGSEPIEPGWELRLQLTTSAGYKWGYFSLFRTCVGDQVLVDINLLNSDFRKRLCNALQVATRQADLVADVSQINQSEDAVHMASA